MKKLLWMMVVCTCLWACTKDQVEDCSNPPENKSRYSDYFVFIADDGGTPLVVPIDINWNPTTDGFFQEFKSWHGTSANWPINYYTADQVATACEIPQEGLDQPDNDLFQFNKQSRQITTEISGAPKMTWNVPPSTAWVRVPDASTELETYAFKTTVEVGSTTRSGWAVYERIRAEPGTNNFTADFATYFWFPLVVNNNLYHFEQHKGEQRAIRWQDNNGTIDVDTLLQFGMVVTATAPDSTSGRAAIPEQFSVTVPTWNINITVNSTGFQVGYGPSYPNGLGVYRQSLLEATSTSTDQGYGMLEFIVERD
ncbi:MAG: hypothetical protein ACRBFS_23480 [Aureispira sp.]